MCNNIQNFYWRLILNVPGSCPKLALLSDTFMVDMKYRIFNEKCQLLRRTKQLEDNALAKQVYEAAEEHNWPGLGQEVRDICEEIGIEDINKYEVGKEQIQEAIFEEHYRTMIVQFETSKKLKDIKHDNFRQIQGYFNDKNLSNARLKFKICAQMVDNIPGNFKNKYKYNEEGLNCSECKVEFTQYHRTIFPARSKLREGLNMNSIDDVVTYFRRYLMTEKKEHWIAGSTGYFANVCIFVLHY